MGGPAGCSGRWRYRRCVPHVDHPRDILYSGRYIICGIPTFTYKCSPVVTESNYYSYECTFKCSQRLSLIIIVMCVV